MLIIVFGIYCFYLGRMIKLSIMVDQPIAVENMSEQYVAHWRQIISSLLSLTA